MRTLSLTLALSCSALLVACGDKDDTTTTDDTSVEADADTDTDTDTDTDADADADTDTDTDADTDVSISDIQGGTATGDQTISGVVTSPQSDYGFFMADAPGAWNGLWIYTGGDDGVDIGSAVTVTGTVEEFNDLTEINATEGTVVVDGTNTVWDATVVPVSDFADAATAEQWESVLITIENVTVTNTNADGPDNDFGEFEVDGTLRVDDLYYDADPAENDTYASITGILTYSYGNYKLSPRNADDVVK